MNLDKLLEIIRNMEPMPGREFKPHRYLALMAIIDIIENQEEPQNRFYYNDDFKNYFIHYFNIYRGPNDRNRPFRPFFHLKNAGMNAGGFWFLSPRPGENLNNLRSGFSEHELTEIVENGELDLEMFKILSSKDSGQKSREIVRNVIKECLKAGLQTNL